MKDGGNDETITLREAARRFNRREGEVSVCTCKSGCGNKRCKCFQTKLEVHHSMPQWAELYKQRYIFTCDRVF